MIQKLLRQINNLYLVSAFSLSKNITCLVLLFMFLAGCSSQATAIWKGNKKMDSSTRIFNYNGILINYSDTGSGQPLILLHGFGASSYSWRYIEKSFSKHYRVIRVDLKGFGLSGKPLDDNYSVADQSLIIQQFIKEKNFKNVILVGHSFGGAIAIKTFLELNSNNTNPISKLILIDSAAYKQHLPNFIALLRTPLLNNLLLYMLPNKVSAKIILKEAFYDDSKISDEMIQTYASYLELPGAHHALIKTAKQIIPNNINNLTQRYKSIEIPVLIIWGEKDMIIPLKIGKMLSENIVDSKLVIIPNCGHIPQEECPQETIKLISDFLDDVS